MIDADFQLADGRVAHVHARRFLVSTDVTVRDGEHKVVIQYGAQSETDKLKDLLSMLGPLLTSLAAAGVVP